MRHKKIMTFLLMFTLLVIIAIQGIKLEKYKKKQNINMAEAVDYISDTGYKLFFGEWEIADFLEGGRFSDKERAAAYVGKIMSFDMNSIKMDGKVLVINPRYDCTIIPMEKYRLYKPYTYPNDVSEVFDLDAPFFVHIKVANTYDLNNQFFEFGNFYVKDDSILILDTDFGMFRMERVSHIDNYESAIPPI